MNQIKSWLDSKLQERNLSVESFAHSCGISRAAIYFFRSDKNRPTKITMMRMCQVLGVPAEEGLAQYIPKTSGRPVECCSGSQCQKKVTHKTTPIVPGRLERVVKTEHTQMPRLSEIISEIMEKRGLTINSLAKLMDLSYEHTRRIVRGESIPTKFVLKAICDELKLPYKQLLDTANADNLTKKYGDLLAVMVGKNPAMEPLERIWDDLTEDQQQDLIAMAQGWARRTRASRTSLGPESDAGEYSEHDAAK